MLREFPIETDERLLVGLATGDDAGVFEIAPGVALVQTVDFFASIVDDPETFGRIAAANSLSDIYAMGGVPLTALNILCFPIGERGPNEAAAILRGASEALAEAGVVLLGGHSVDDLEPKFGLAVTGRVDPRAIATNAGAKPGDAIVLTKPLGAGVITTAAMSDNCPPDVYEAACASMVALNAAAAEAMRAVGIGPEGVHAATDITGFGLLGHLYAIARESRVRLEIDASALPLLPGALELAAAGFLTGGGSANEEYLAEVVSIADGLAEGLRALLYDPQTSGGLAICVARERLPALLDELQARSAPCSAVIGSVVSAGSPHIRVVSGSQE